MEDTVQYGRSLQRNEKGRGRGRPSPKNGKGRGRGVTVNRHDPPCSFVLPPGEKGKLWPSTARSPHCASHDARVRPALLSHGARMRVRGLIASIRCLAGVDRSSCSSGKRFDLCRRRPFPARGSMAANAAQTPAAPIPTVRVPPPGRDGFARVASGNLCAPIGRRSFPVHRNLPS